MQEHDDIFIHRGSSVYAQDSIWFAGKTICICISFDLSELLLLFSIMASTPYHSYSPSASRAGSARHGSAEQELPRDVFGRPTGQPPQTPRTSTVRSNQDEDDDRERDRDERREQRGRSRQQRAAQQFGDQQIGMNFRINAIEKTLRDHEGESTTQKGTVQKMVNAIEALQNDKSKLEERLNKTFTDWNQRIADSDNRNVGFKGELQSLVQTLSNKVDKLTEDFAVLLSKQSPPPGIPTGPTSGTAQPNSIPRSFNIGSPPPTTKPDNSWSPLNPTEG